MPETFTFEDAAKADSESFSFEDAQPQYDQVEASSVNLPKIIGSELVEEPRETLRPQGKLQSLVSNLQNIPVVGRVFQPTKLPYEVEQEAGEEPAPQTATEAAARGARNILGGVINPESAALIAATGGAGAIPRVGGALSKVIASGIGAKAVGDAIRKGGEVIAPGKTTPERVQALVEGLGSGAVGYAGLRHAVTPYRLTPMDIENASGVIDVEAVPVESVPTQAKPARVPLQLTDKAAETVPGTSIPAEPIKTPVDIAPVKPADTSGLSEAVRTFQTQLEDPEFVANNKHSAAAGMGLKSVADLDALAEMDAKQKADLKQRLAEADRTGDMSALMRNMAKPQLPREVIETATKTGSWENDEPALGVTGDRPLDWRKNPEVAEWLRKNGERIGIVLPEELKSPATPSVTPKVTEAAKPAAEAQAGIDKVRRTEGATNAKEAKAQLVGELEKAHADAPIVGAGAVTVEVPGDGTFKMENAKDSIAKVLARAKQISTKPGGGPVPIKRRGISKEDQALVDEQLKAGQAAVPTVAPEAPTVAEKGQIVPQTGQIVPKTEQNVSLPDYDEVGTGDETAQNMQARPGANPSTGLPAGVPDRGPRFASELLEASRQLDALVRYRGTLRPSVEQFVRVGQFVRARSAIGHNDKIEVGDIQNQGTVAHEIGHALDATLWPDIFASPSRGSQRSLYERAKTGTAKELHAELVKVSELMRGPITGSKGHIAYRRSATELIADFASLYMHDPAQASALAPKFAQGFENALARVPDAHGVIVQLHGEGIEPEAPGGRAGPAAVPTATAGAVPAKEVAAPITRDVPLVMAAEDLVKGEVRQFEAEQQRARVKADSWRKRLPDRGDREDVGAFVEGIGNVTLPGDTIANVQSRMTPAMKALAKDFRFDIELQRQRINQYLKFLDQGDYLKFLEDYLPHFYANGKAAVTSALGRFIKESPNAKRRTLPTLQEAVEYGLVPITQDPAVLYEHTARINWRVATNRKMLGKLKELKTTSGEPVVVPAKDAPPGWPISNNPLIQQTYAHPTDSGAMVIWKGGAAIHPDAFRAVRQMLDTPVSSDLGKAYDVLNGFTRANAFAFSLFHDITLRSASAGALMRWYNPVRGLFRLFERNPVTGELQVFRSTRSIGKELLQDEAIVADAAQHGLKFSWTESESYQKNARDFLEKAAARWRETPFLGRSAALARDIQHMRQQGLWKNTHDAYKIIAYNDLTAKALQNAPPGTSSKAVKEAVASLLNDAFGGQEWQTKFWLSPQTRLMMSRFFLAPDWTLSTLRSVPGVSDVASAVRGQSGRLTGRGPMPTSKEGVRGNLGRARFWGGEIAALAMATIAAQYAIYQMFGDKKKGDKPWIWENETEQQRRVDATPLMRKLPWHKANDPTRYYINLGKRPEEIIGWVIHPEQNTLSKMARPVAELFRQVTGTEGDFKAQWKRDHESFLESLPARGKSIIGQAVPFTLSGNQFAMALPYRKGMTRYKAQQSYESAYELIAEPNRFRAFLRGHNVGGQPQRGIVEQTPQTLLNLVTDAAKRNGVPAGEVQAHAASIVRGKYYGEYFKALKSGDKKALTNAAESLQRLGATFEGVQKSMEKRQTMEPIPAK